MRRLSLALAAVFALAGASAEAQTLALASGQAVRIDLKAPVRDVVVANPQTADVSVVNERTLVVMGRTAGVTTVMAFDAAGRTILEREVQVAQRGGGGVVVYRGSKNTTTYACGTECARIDQQRDIQ